MSQNSLQVKNVATTSSSDDLNGRKLEFLGGMSSVLSSRAAKGYFFKFVERLAYNLTLEGHQWTLLRGELSDDCLKFLKDFTVPFLAPIASAWDTDLRDLLTVHFQQTLELPKDKASEISGGTCQLFAKTEQYDLSIMNGNGDEVIAMEFKLHQDSLSGKDLKIIFEKIHEHSDCHVGFIVALNFAAALKKKENWKDLPSNYFIYSLARVKDKSNTLAFVKHFPLSKPRVKGQRLQFIMSEEVNLGFDLEARIVEPECEKLKVDLKGKSSGKKKKNPKKRIRRPNEPLILILVSLLDLNKIENTKSFLKAAPGFTGGM